MVCIPTSIATTVTRIKNALPQSSTRWASSTKRSNSTCSGYRIIFYWPLFYAVSSCFIFSGTCLGKLKTSLINWTCRPVTTPSLSKGSPMMLLIRVLEGWLTSRYQPRIFSFKRFSIKLVLNKTVSTIKLNKLCFPMMWLNFWLKNKISSMSSRIASRTIQLKILSLKKFLSPISSAKLLLSYFQISKPRTILSTSQASGKDLLTTFSQPFRRFPILESTEN